MKLNLSMAVMGLALVLPHGAPAETDEDSAAMGRLEAVITFCARAAPKHVAQYEHFMTTLVSFGEGAESVTIAARSTETYQSAYKDALAEFEKLPGTQAAEACAAMTGTKD